jgi:hypothetical protein
VKQTGSVTIKASMKTGMYSRMEDTYGFKIAEYTDAHFEMKTVSPFTGTVVGGPTTSWGG